MRLVSSVLFLLVLPSFAFAQGYGSRGPAGSWEWGVSGIYQGTELSASGGGSSVDVDDAFGLGLTFGYYVTDRIMLGGEMEWLRPDYDATLVSETGEVVNFSHELSQFNFRFKGAFNLMDGPFTPYLDLNAGWTYFDSNVANGPPIVGCWWVWPWGYVCDGYYNTYGETAFSYGAGLGLRYQFTGGTMLKLSYNSYRYDDVGSAGGITLDAAKLEFAWGF